MAGERSKYLPYFFRGFHWGEHEVSGSFRSTTSQRRRGKFPGSIPRLDYNRKSENPVSVPDGSQRQTSRPSERSDTDRPRFTPRDVPDFPIRKAAWRVPQRTRGGDSPGRTANDHFRGTGLSGCSPPETDGTAGKTEQRRGGVSQTVWQPGRVPAVPTGGDGRIQKHSATKDSAFAAD